MIKFLDNGIVVIYDNGWYLKKYQQNIFTTYQEGEWVTLCSEKREWLTYGGKPFSNQNEAVQVAKKYHKCGKKAYDPEFGDDKLCAECGHPYYRHFDSYENNEPVGCKYCGCPEFME